MKTAVIYARYSSHGQTEQSIEGQIRKCRQFADKNDLLVIHEYIDRAKSATTNNRPSFQQMLLDSSLKQFDYVIVYAIDRFSRSDIDYGVDKKTLLSNGVKLLSATENIGTNADGSENLGGILTEGVLIAVAKYYSRELSKKVRRGQYESLQKGKFLGGRILYGYTVQNQHIIIDHEQANIVKMIFELYSKGYSAITIAQILNDKNILNAKGQPFKHCTIMAMLKNQKYIGITKHREYISTNHYTPIIDKHTFEIVQSLIEKNKHNPARAKAKIEYLLSGKLFCGICKAPMNGESGTSCTGTIYYYYKCKTKKTKCACNKSNIGKTLLEDMVLYATKKHILQPNIIEELTQQILQLQNEQREKSQITLLEKQLAQTNTYIKNILKAIKNGMLTSSTQEELLCLEKEKEELENKIIQAKFETNSFLDRDMILNWLNQFITCDIENEEERKYLIHYFIHKVILYEDKIIIIFNHYDKNTVELDISAVERSIENDTQAQNSIANNQKCSNMTNTAPPDLIAY